MSEQSIENKQKYLREKILQKGYDAEAFMGYCEEKYGQINLEGWTFSKLKQIVKGYLGQQAEVSFTQQQLDNQQTIQVKQYQQQNVDFTHHKNQVKKQIVFTDADWQIFGFGLPPKKQGQSGLQHNQNIKTNNMQNKNQNRQQKKQLYTFTKTQQNSKPQILTTAPNLQAQSQIPKVNQNGGEKKNFGRQFEQLKIEQISKIVPGNEINQIGTFQVNVVSSRAIPAMPQINEIKIINTEQKSKNFLQGDYTLYHIQYCPCNIIVKKKFNDFRKLRTILQKIYPHIRLPYLQPEGWLGNGSQIKDAETSNKYKYQIIQFLKYVTIKNQLLKKSKIVRLFTGLMQSSHDELKKYQNIARPKQYFQMCLPNGKLSFSKYQSCVPVDKYMNNVVNLTTSIDNHYEKLRKSLQNLFYNYQNLAKSLTEVAGIFQSLESLVQKFNFDNDTKKDLRIYEGIKQVCLKMRQRVDCQSQIFRNKIHNFFKYERENMTTMKQLNQNRIKMYNQYVRQGLNSKKSTQLISKGDSNSQNNISIQQPCKVNKLNLTIQNMFWSYFSLKGHQQYWQQLRYKINQKLTLIAYDQLDAENDNLNFWNNVIKKCVI